MEPLPEAVPRSIRDTGERGSALAAGGPALPLKSRDAVTAALRHQRPRARELCLLCTDGHLAMPPDKEKKFQTALEKLGYPFPRTWSLIAVMWKLDEIRNHVEEDRENHRAA